MGLHTRVARRHVPFVCQLYGEHNLALQCMHTRNTWEYTGKKGGFGRKGYVACTGGYKCTMHNACIGGVQNTSSVRTVSMMINVVFENTPFWALGVYGRIRKSPIPQYTAVNSGVYGRILRIYGRILGVLVCTRWLFQVEKFHI